MYSDVSGERGRDVLCAAGVVESVLAEWRLVSGLLRPVIRQLRIRPKSVVPTVFYGTIVITHPLAVRAVRIITCKKPSSPH